MKEFFYISGSLGLHLLINVISTLLIYRYDPGMPNDNNLPLLVSSAWIGMAQLVGRTIGAWFLESLGKTPSVYCPRNFTSYSQLHLNFYAFPQLWQHW
jgi:GPH family glycoside/pentoside/hexuronide:cation symporter